jgi:hypothetical protein
MLPQITSIQPRWVLMSAMVVKRKA